jgi:hypothetical protein
MLAQDIFSSVKDISDLVYNTLCNYEQLEPGIFPMTQRMLVRDGQPCGIHFCLHGPRNVKYTSIWETDRNSILFYNSIGERFHRTELKEAPKLTTASQLAPT